MTGAAAVLAIGLNRGAREPLDQLTRTLGALAARGGVHDVALGVSVWQGARERSLQVLFTAAAVEETARELAECLHQDCIAVLYPGADRWRLVYASGAVEDGGTLAEFPLTLKG